MTLDEIRNKILESEDSNWFTSIQVNINYPHVNYTLSITGASAIYEFVLNQTEGWSKKGEDIPNELKNSKTFFKGILDKLVELVNTKVQNLRESTWNSIKSQLENSKKIFPFEVPEVGFLIKVFRELPKSYPAAYNFILGNVNVNAFADKNSTTGTLLAYEFSMKDKSEISERRNSEKASISRQKTQLTQYLSQTENEIAKFLHDAHEKNNGYTSSIDELKKSKEELFDEWFNETQHTFKTFDETATQKISDLERTYEELLRLKKPADYWNKRATVLKKEGNKFLYWLIGLVLFGCISLYLLLWLTPEGMLLSFIKGQASAIKWSIVYITFISLLAFGVKAVSKAMFSSFHLARDAEEREQLTYVYLALIKESAIDEKDKSLIMQSLFSRADTGLLKEDSSPTMPGVFADKVIQGK